MCGDESLQVRFPFRLESYQPQHCGYPGLDLTCEGNKTVLKLPYSGKFYVRQVSYISQQILLYDPNNCLPKRLLNLNMSGSPFESIFQQNYTFLSCPSSFTKSRFTPIDCLSNSTTSVLATPSISLANRMTDSDSCKIIKTVSIPIPGPVRYEEESSINLDDDLRLMWYVPNCSICESQGGLCGFASNNSEDIGCFADPKSGKRLLLLLFSSTN